MSETYALHGHDRYTHQNARLFSGLSARSVADLLAKESGGYDPQQLKTFSVIDEHNNELSAESWLEDHPVEALLSAWTAGGSAARTARQQKLHEWWPALGAAIVNLEAHDAQA